MPPGWKIIVGSPIYRLFSVSASKVKTVNASKSFYSLVIACGLLFFFSNVANAFPWGLLTKVGKASGSAAKAGGAAVKVGGAATKVGAGKAVSVTAAGAAYGEAKAASLVGASADELSVGARATTITGHADDASSLGGVKAETSFHELNATNSRRMIKPKSTSKRTLEHSVDAADVGSSLASYESNDEDSDVSFFAGVFVASLFALLFCFYKWYVFADEKPRRR